MQEAAVMSLDTTNLADLQSSIGYTFTDEKLLVEALTHRSYLNEAQDKSLKDNERLEFFGDAVLDFFLSQLLLERFPRSREGELTRTRASVVDEEALATMAQRIGLGKHLRLGRGEERSGGRGKKSILADAYEALLAAIYLDGGVSQLQRLVESHLECLLDQRASASRDFKTEFQELVQSRFGMTPHYQLRRTAGPDHDRVFTVAAFAGTECMGEGAGRTKKEAEQAAARMAIARLQTGEP